MQRKLFTLGTWLYLAGIACLIVRNNTYPWPIKRSSDIFFLAAALFALPFFFQEYRELKKLKIAFRPAALFVFGVLFATIIRIATHHPTTTDGLLEALRVFEVIALLFLTGSFVLLDETFAPRVLLAQLSTLVYTGIFLLPYSSWSWMYRFEWLENWPSNTSYYLAVSLTFLAACLFYAWRVRSKNYILAALALIPLFSFFLWSQTRASWLGFGFSLIVLAVLWFRENKKAAVYALLTLAVAGSLGLALLPPIIQGDVIHRLFPGIPLSPDRSRETPAGTTPTTHLLNIEDPTRSTLWGIYVNRLIKEPWGQGVEYDAVNIGHGPQGPHNTLLEVMVLGGFFALTGYLSLFYFAFRNLERKFGEKENRKIYRWTLLGALLALFVASLFDNLSTFRLLWIVLALGLFLGKNEVVRSQTT
jgi:hypothetical protein